VSAPWVVGDRVELIGWCDVGRIIEAREGYAVVRWDHDPVSGPGGGAYDDGPDHDAVDLDGWLLWAGWSGWYTPVRVRRAGGE